MTSAELEAYLHTKIPISGLMEIHVESSSGGEIVLTAPLSTNHNHLGTAFGGSLAAIATLAGYCALWHALGDKDAHIVIRRSSIEYLRPVNGQLRAVCKLGQEEIQGTFLSNFRRHGKARMNLNVSISENGKECVKFTGEFVALI